MCSSDRVHRWRLILEEYGPEINLIKGIHNTIADAIARLDFPPKANHVQEMDKQTWMTLTKYWCTLENNTENSNNEHEMEIDHVFANHSEEEDVYPSTVCEIAEEQLIDEALQK